MHPTNQQPQNYSVEQSERCDGVGVNAQAISVVALLSHVFCGDYEGYTTVPSKICWTNFLNEEVCT